MGIYLVEGEIFLDVEGRDEGVIVGPEPSEDIRDGLLLAQWLPDGSESVRQTLHVAIVVRRRDALLLGGCELRADLDGPCTSDLDANMRSRMIQAARAVGAFMMATSTSSVTVERNPLSTVWSRTYQVAYSRLTMTMRSPAADVEEISSSGASIEPSM